MSGSTRSRPLYGERDRRFIQKLDEENIKRTGSRIVYYSRNRGVNVDPLYSEPLGWTFRKFPLAAGHIEYEEKDGREVSVRDEGKTVMLNARLNISLIEWQREAYVDGGLQRLPKAGDVIDIQLEVWDVVQANSAGNVIDRPDFTGFQLELRKRSKFVAQRKIMPRADHVDPVNRV